MLSSLILYILLRNDYVRNVNDLKARNCEEAFTDQQNVTEPREKHQKEPDHSYLLSF